MRNTIVIILIVIIVPVIFFTVYGTDFFTPAPVHYHAGFLVYLDGKLQRIKPYDSVIIIIGDTSGIDVTKTVSRSHIDDVEKRSEGCSV
jgi:hypothetical protein